MDEIIISFPKQYKALPKGYEVIYSELDEHYFWKRLEKSGDYIYSDAFSDKYDARHSAFAHWNYRLSFPFSSKKRKQKPSKVLDSCS